MNNEVKERGYRGKMGWCAVLVPLLRITQFQNAKLYIVDRMLAILKRKMLA